MKIAPKWDKIKKLQGDMTNAEFAAKLGINRTYLWQIKVTDKAGDKFIDSILRLSGGEFEDYFKTNY
jgi:hypothetical protein